MQKNRMTREQMRASLASAGVTAEVAALLKTTQRLLFSAMAGYRQDTTIDGNANIAKGTQDQIEILCEKMRVMDEKKLRRFLKTHYLAKAVELGVAASDRNRLFNAASKKKTAARA